MGLAEGKMKSLFTSNQDIRLKKSISLNFWVTLFVFLQILIPLCDYLLKKLGIGDSFAPLYTKTITNTLLLFFSLLLLAKQGVNFKERLAEYKKNAGLDLSVSLAIAVAGLFLGYLMIHFNVHGQVFSVNSVVLNSLFSEPSGSSSCRGFALILFSYCLLVPITEEIFFRRLLYVSLRQRYGLFRAISTNSILFGLIHPDAVLFTILFGLIQCLVYERFGRVSINITSHLIFNSAVITLSFLGI